MKLVIIGVGALVISALAGVLLATPVAAEPPGTAATATAHAVDELKNAIAQGKITLTPSPSPTSTATPLPPTTAPSPLPTEEAPATSTPLPALPVPQVDDPLTGYTRSMAAPWLELALPQGRWAVYQADNCRPQIGAWAPVQVSLQDSGEVDLEAAGVRCGLVWAVWQSDAPCATGDDGVCDVAQDSSYWDMLSRLPTETPLPSATSRPAPTAMPQASQPASTAAAQVQVRTVIQTVIVEVTAVPSDTTASSTPTHLASGTPRPTATPNPTRTASPNATAIRTPLPAEAALATVGPRARGTVSPPRPGQWDWGFFLRAAALVVLVGALAIWLLTRRRVVRWGARSKPVEETHA